MTSLRLGLTLPALVGILLFPPAFADDAGLTKDQADAILNELRHIRQVLQRMEKQQRSPAANTKRNPAQPRTLKISIQDRPVFGDPEAPVTLVEFVDFQCPFCKRFIQNVYPTLKQNYIDKGLLRMVIKDMPLGFHAEARQAAQAAHCAGEQDAYWGMHDMLYERAGKLDKQRFLVHAAELGLDATAFEACLTTGRHLDQIDGDSSEAAGIGVTGTPSFIIGKSGTDSVEGAYIRGARPYAVFRKEIEALLKGKS